MIATGTDIRPLEIVFFMRRVRSRGFFEQMKGRGTRVITPDDLQAVTPDAKSKTHFIIVDAVGKRKCPTRARFILGRTVLERSKDDAQEGSHGRTDRGGIAAGRSGREGDTATLNRILSDNYLGVGQKGEALGKQEQVTATTATSANVQNASYTADEYKFQVP